MDNQRVPRGGDRLQDESDRIHILAPVTGGGIVGVSNFAYGSASTGALSELRTTKGLIVCPMGEGLYALPEIGMKAARLID